jgi:peptidoglycan/LPS O-acetylase OafA/YrhL
MIYRPEIDGLRALAVMPVIFFHAGVNLFSGGFIGVDIFFVISGYLIAGIIISEIKQENFSLADFYERRARRIFPALFFVMFSCLPFAWLWLTPSNLIDFGKSLIAVPLFISNGLFWYESGYFEAASELKPLLHTWSIAVEEQFYLIFPIFLIFTWKLGFRWIIALLVIIFFASLFFANWGAYNQPSATFYLLPSRGWELILGILCAFYLSYKNQPSSMILNQLLSILGFACIVSAIIFFDKNTPSPSLYTLIPTLGTALLVLTTTPKTFVYKILTLKIFTGMGLISYSAYLWHQPIIAFTKHRLLINEFSFYHLFFICVSSLILAYFTWRFIEKPFRNKAIFTSHFILKSSSACIILFCIIGFSFVDTKGTPSRVNFEPELLSSLNDISPKECLVSSFDTQPIKWGCFLGNDTKNIDYIMFGDSHSLSLVNLVDEIALKKNISVFYAGAEGCLPFLGVFPDRSNSEKQSCNLLNKRIFNLSNEKNIKGIILSSRWSFYVSHSYGVQNAMQFISNNPQGPFNQNASIDTFQKLFNKTISSYKKLGISVHIISQPPLQNKLAETLYFSLGKGYGSLDSLSVSRNDFEELESIPHNLFFDNQTKINYHHIIDNFCNLKNCFFGTKQSSYYYDDDHLSHIGAKRITKTMERILSSG